MYCQFKPWYYVLKHSSQRRVPFLMRYKMWIRVSLINQLAVWGMTLKSNFRVLVFIDLLILFRFAAVINEFLSNDD